MLSGDTFVGMVAAGLGLVLLVATGVDAPWTHRWQVVRMVEGHFGRTAGRLFAALLGLALVALAIYLLFRQRLPIAGPAASRAMPTATALAVVPSILQRP